jgi:uncharacterized protein involved in outer membrane biogenesis
VKKILKILVGILAIVIVLLLIVAIFLGPIIKTGVEKVGSKVANVDMQLEKASVNLFAGKVSLKGLVIGNPEGFKTASAMELGEFIVNLDMASLLTDTIVIKKIHIDGPQITYERGLKASNLSTIQKGLAAEAKEEVEEEAAPEEKKAPAKKVVIEEFIFEDGKINVSLTVAGGKKMTIPLPAIRLEDIGKESDGASVPEVISEVMGAITDGVGKAVAASTGVAGDTVKGVGDAAGEAGATAVDAVKDVGGAIKGLFGK